jgi:hypothetical protein
MKILLDHCVPRRLGAALGSHEVGTAAGMGWSALRNGALLRAAAQHGFDALLTVDRNLKHEQNLAALPTAVVVLLATSNRLSDLLPLVPAVEDALAGLAPRTLVEVSRATP